jgi:hypothetical protein
MLGVLAFNHACLPKQAIDRVEYPRHLLLVRAPRSSASRRAVMSTTTPASRQESGPVAVIVTCSWSHNVRRGCSTRNSWV